MACRYLTASAYVNGVRHFLTWKGYLLAAVATIAFVNVVLAIFGNTIPNTFLSVFGNMIPGVFQTAFKVAASSVVLGAVLIFIVAWLLKTRPHYRPKSYRVVVFDVYGCESFIDNLRLNFRNTDVAWSYMKQYKQRYPLHNFALVSDDSQTRPTIYRYI